MNKLVVGLPCYNEEENIGRLIGAWQKEAQGLASLGYDLVIMPVDDKSTDSTRAIIQDKAQAHDNLDPIYHEKNRNLGGGMDSIIGKFLRDYQEDDLLAVMDGDMSHSPTYISSMLEALGGHDCVIASRYREGSRVLGVPKIRLFYSLMARVYYSLVLGVRGVRDYTCGYRLYRYPILKRAWEVFSGDLVQRTSFACMMEILYKLHLVGASFTEVPFTLRYDKKEGASKIRLGQTIKDSLLTALQLRALKGKKDL